MITNVNTGVDASRIQRNEPSFFVNWQENGENHYIFSTQCWYIEILKTRLLAWQKEDSKND